MRDTLTLRGYKITNRKGLKHWEPLLEEWLLLIERYCRVGAGEDAPFIYTERANIGLLAGAAWRCGWIALEEFQYEKGYRNKPKWNGRADLYLGSENKEEIIEAKFDWLSLYSSKNALRRAGIVLTRAIKAAKVTRGGNSNLNCVAVAFLPAWLPTKKSDILEKNIEETIAEFVGANFHAIAWCFPKEYRWTESSKGNYTPGVVLVISKCE
jgi:hypothetical protein